MRFLPLIALVASVVDLQPAGLSRIEHQRVRQMLVSIRNEIRKNYYDPAFRGMDIEQHFKAAEAKLEEATSLGHAMAIIAQSLLDFDDSHLFFFPPNRTATVDYGWVMQMVGNDCYIVAVRPTPDDLTEARDPVLARAAAILELNLNPATAGAMFPSEWR
jgi:hypothetical protein